MAVRGRALNDDEVSRIVRLLADTDMSIPDIARRMHRSRSAVATINSKWKVRTYSGLKEAGTNGQTNLSRHESK
jgi:hypothetical protein